MKIFILRHEDRTMDATFFSPLTSDGLENSIKLIEYLKQHKIDCIFSSPFIRTLQTIHPYAKTHNLKINIDHSLAEIQHPHIIPVKSYTINLPTYIAEQFNYNPNYMSTMNPQDHVYPETDKHVAERVKKFMKKLISEMLETDHNIIIVTHQVVCNIILQMATKKMDNIKIEPMFNYPRGGLTKVFDKDHFVFEPINWKFTAAV
jgi:broad specificity phosphatase PhoE